MILDPSIFPTRVCRSCREEKTIVLDFSLKSYMCRPCSTAKAKAKRRKEGTDPKLKWNTFKMGYRRQRDELECI